MSVIDEIGIERQRQIEQEKRCQHWINGETDATPCPYCRIKALETQLAEAHEVIDTYAGCVDGYYVETGHCYISADEEYRAKWKIE